MSNKGVLLVNLGSPDSTDPKDVKKYLGEFLMDERVIDVPYWFRAFLVKGIILNTRPKKSAAAYKKIWWKEGSPLIVLSERLQEKVDAHTSVPVALAMRYGSITIKNGLQKLYDQGITEVLVVPLYPQFAMATTETILVLAEELREKYFPEMKLSSIPAFYNKPEYIEVLSNSIAEKLEGLGQEHLLFSYHGVPERHIRKSDITKSHCKIDGQCCQSASPAHPFCYRHQCYETTRLVAEKLGLKEGSFSTSFQSRLGFDPWLQPYTDRTIERLGLEGIKKMAIVTPAFVSDCLETLEEIAMEGAALFYEVGGKEFTTIPCINTREDWVRVLSGWIDHWALVDTETAIA
ncbi:MAG: ferrochelatase [Flavobacteriaceae bacterium CG2_30_34_30]|nr:ferrochelatase [Flavobacteriia bacterium]OIP51572.1 MAG: ferrochelatase [Flavobacteriaceae bacterium CG2_30_34_30]PIQ19242.1 MAG: ferrochelatase [Flavobacteriaceae bacterium CG18_big_fil_WC_8_21_14_2_50_34_36]PIV48466.1 MAG: ferrochelatase [Flavobacteriaceae bacterium CG02_land_8_20_14_3_00_34_13]PIZ08896.1 MAG: ferrochelatase [Flavobacteriaceae bacterium CG_4_10_14_0_8_um_filter_34_31]